MPDFKWTDEKDANDASLDAFINLLQEIIEEFERIVDADVTLTQDHVQGDQEGTVPSGEDASDSDSDSGPRSPGWQHPKVLRRTVSNVGEVNEGNVSESVRNDGSIEVDGLRGIFRGLLHSVSMAWMLINGRVPNTDTGADGQAARTADILMSASEFGAQISRRHRFRYHFVDE